MIRQVNTNTKKRQRYIKWRGHEILRIEGFSDAVFAFAMTLLVVSLEVPKTFEELKQGMSGMLGFAICFTLLFSIWHEQYIYFRLYFLKDIRTIVINGILLFVVLFYVYPLKFLFAFLTQGNKIVEHGEEIHRMTTVEQLQELMVIYGLGFVLVYIVFLLMYMNAWSHRVELGLRPIEEFHTKTAIYKQLCMISIGLAEIIFALMLPPQQSGIAGMTYIIIYPVFSLLFHFRKKKLQKLFTPDELNAHHIWTQS